MYLVNVKKFKKFSTLEFFPDHDSMVPLANIDKFMTLVPLENVYLLVNILECLAPPEVWSWDLIFQLLGQSLTVVKC